MALLMTNNGDPFKMSLFVLYHPGLHGFNINRLIKISFKHTSPI